jgi:predicted O-methyltransferase YrrM
MSEYKFTQDWFHWSPQVWEQLIPHLPEPRGGGREFLEIGSFEGRSAVWIMDNMMQDGDHLVCVDTWEGGEEHSEEDMEAVYARFCHNMEAAQAKFPARRYTSVHYYSIAQLAAAIKECMEYDFIYIDGSHTAPDVLTDACMAWQVLRPKGIMVFDDYMWGSPRDILHRPKIAIDAFCNIFAEQLEPVHVGYQLIVRKKEQS